MPKRPYDILVFIGRFQPFHLGHQRVIDRALELADHVVILIGSANCARSLRNPWTFEERRDLIDRHYRRVQADNYRLDFFPLNDVLYNETAWIEQAQRLVQLVASQFPGNSAGVTIHGSRDMKVGLIGAAKDRSSYYLKLFPNWASEDVAFLEPDLPIHATDLRLDYFNGFIPTAQSPHLWECGLPKVSALFLRDWSMTDEYKALRQEAKFVAQYKKQWENTPYPVTFSTVDAVVVQSGNVLLVRRGGHPGKGQLALPGGFVGYEEKLLDAAIRELREETRLKVPEAVLRGSMVKREIFDDPHRSSRGRTITTAFLFHLANAADLPKVKGSDDAAEAAWHSLGAIDPREMYEDHYHILKAMTAGI